MLKPSEKLYNLYSEHKRDMEIDNDPDEEYLNELIAQVKLFATDCNTLTKLFIKKELQNIVDNIRIT
jgi:hypothetical protein